MATFAVDYRHDSNSSPTARHGHPVQVSSSQLHHKPFPALNLLTESGKEFHNLLARAQQKPMCHLNLCNLMHVQEQHITNSKSRFWVSKLLPSLDKRAYHLLPALAGETASKLASPSSEGRRPLLPTLPIQNILLLWKQCKGITEQNKFLMISLGFFLSSLDKKIRNCTKDLCAASGETGPPPVEIQEEGFSAIVSVMYPWKKGRASPVPASFSQSKQRWHALIEFVEIQYTRNNTMLRV
ncbi:hypothetical protein J6590_035575 [Homalodisca vitripennis]|nr:hypothetical protein J6590_035575 [Homalodisca vitripennis]